MIEYILWISVVILQIINIVVMIKQYKTINELNAEIDDLRDDNVWYNNRFKAVAKHCRELRDRIDDARHYINDYMCLLDNEKEELLRKLEDKNSTTVTLNTKDMNVSYMEVKNEYRK